MSGEKQRRSTELAGLLDRQPVWRTAALIFVVCCGIFGLTAEWNDQEVNVDAVASALPAWSLATQGTIDLPPGATANPWVNKTANGTISNRPPGTWLGAVPAYLVLGDPESFSTDPATGSAVLVTSAAMAVLFLVLSHVSTPTAALLGTLVMAFGSATWPISSSQLWPHGTGQLALAIGLLGLATGRYWMSGAGFGFGIWARPPTALFPALTGIGVASWRKGRWIKPLLGVGVPSLVFLLTLVTYNRLVFRETGVRGGYSSDFVDRLATPIASEYFANLGAMLIFPRNGIAFWSPVVIICAAAAGKMWTKTSHWIRWSAVAAVVYLLVHARLNRASGGLPFNYRYPLEAITMAAPLLLIGAMHWMNRGGARRFLVLASAGFSIVMQALYVLTLDCQPFDAGRVICQLGF